MLSRNKNSLTLPNQLSTMKDQVQMYSIDLKHEKYEGPNIKVVKANMKC